MRKTLRSAFKVRKQSQSSYCITIPAKLVEMFNLNDKTEAPEYYIRPSGNNVIILTRSGLNISLPDENMTRAANYNYNPYRKLPTNY